MTSSNKCPNCGNTYENVGKHWVASKDCDRPELTEKQMEIAKGLLMGDGNISTSDGNPRLRTNMTNKKYLEYLDSKFGCLSNGAKFAKSAEECASIHRKSGFNKNAKEKNYSDVYSWSSSRHTGLKGLAEWYSSGEKKIPEGLTLTPTILKNWYVCDGHFYDDRGHHYISIAIYNERENTDKIDKIFESSGLPKPSNYSRGKRSCDAEFTVEQTEKLFSYMGEPVNGFEYKW